MLLALPSFIVHIVHKREGFLCIYHQKKACSKVAVLTNGELLLLLNSSYFWIMWQSSMESKPSLLLEKNNWLKDVTPNPPILGNIFSPLLLR